MRPLNRLTARLVATIAAPGYYNDGAGLLLQVSATGTKSWLFRYKRAGRRHELGLGSARAVTLAQAREAARQCRQSLANGGDPLAERRERDSQARAKAARTLTFREATERYIEAHQAAWSRSNLKEWTGTIERHASPTLGDLALADIDTPVVLRALELVWREHPKTAAALRGRIEAILAWATVRGFRSGDNPARWRGHLDKLLPRPARVRAPRHHMALPYRDLPAVVERLRADPSIAARLVEFLALAATRFAEAAAMTWEEVDGDTWTVPAERMKARRAHRVPLPERALEILAELRPLGAELVFPGGQAGRPFTNRYTLDTLKAAAGRDDATLHGLRSAFRDWAAERTAYPREVAEAALAHTLGGVEGAYARTDHLERRRRLMADWSEFLAHPAPAGEVVPIRREGT